MNEIDEEEVKKIAQMSDKEFDDYKKANKNKYTSIQMNQARKQRDVAANETRANSVWAPEEIKEKTVEKAGNALFNDEKEKAGEISISNMTDDELVKARNAARGTDKEAAYQKEINARFNKNPDAHKDWAPAKEEPKVDSTDTQVLADGYGLGPEVLTDEDALKEVVEDGTAEGAKDDIESQIEEAGGIDSILPKDRPEDSLHWTQKWAPLLSVLSIAVSAAGLANGVLIPPVNFNKLTNRDEAYNAYLEIVKADQEQKNADTNTIRSPMQAYEEKEAFDKEHGEGAYDKGVSTFGAATEAGQMAVGEQAHEQEKEKLDLIHSLDLEMLDEQTKAEIRKMEQQAENNVEVAEALNQLEIEKAANEISLLAERGIDINDFAKYWKAQSGKTAADTVREYIETSGNVAGNVVDGVVPF